jgi:hypothetical protein
MRGCPVFVNKSVGLSASSYGHACRQSGTEARGLGLHRRREKLIQAELWYSNIEQGYTGLCLLSPYYSLIQETSFGSLRIALRKPILFVSTSHDETITYF